MHSYRNEYSLTNTSKAWFANDATGTTITLANNATPDGYAYKVSVTNAGAADLSSIEFTILGLDQDGKPQTESFFGPGADSSSYSLGYYSYVSEITLSTTLGAETVDIGTSVYFSTKTYPLTTDKTATIGLDLSGGSITFTGECSYNDVSTTEPPYFWQDLTGAGQDFYESTGSDNVFLLSPPNAFRVTTTSINDASFVLTIINNFARG